MDRSRIITTLALILALVSVFIGIANIGMAGRTGSFSSTGDSLFSSGARGIAKINVTGSIRDGQGDGGADRIVKELKSALDSPEVRAVILYINSPGGSVGATKRIYDAVREVRTKKPTVAVISDIAASGGYYVASACDQIFAYEGSIIGSIGVISLRIDVSKFLTQHGVAVTVIKSGKYKDASYPFRAMTQEEIAMDQSMIQDAYMQFLTDVAEGRKQSQVTVAQWAEGKIFSGKQARTFQMIDETGGIDKAVLAIKLMLKTTDDLPVMERTPDFFERLNSQLGAYLFPSSDAANFFGSSIYYLYPDSSIMLKMRDGIVPFVTSGMGR